MILICIVLFEKFFFVFVILVIYGLFLTQTILCWIVDFKTIVHICWNFCLSGKKWFQWRIVCLWSATLQLQLCTRTRIFLSHHYDSCCVCLLSLLFISFTNCYRKQVFYFACYDFLIHFPLIQTQIFWLFFYILKMYSFFIFNNFN